MALLFQNDKIYKAMKIGYDGKRAVQNYTGLGNYSRLVVDSLARFYPQNEYILYAPHDRENPRLKPLLKRDNVRMELPDTAPGRMLSAWWRVGGGMTAQAQRDGVELFHGLSGELPFNICKGGYPSVVTIHDLIFNRYPEYYAAIDRKIYDYKFRKACENATRIIAISECTKRDVMQMYGTPEDKIDVVYQGCHESFSIPADPAVCQHVKLSYGLPERYIVTVGTVESRKNQLLAVKALEKLPDDVMLYIVGGKTDYAGEIEAYIGSHGLSDRVKWLQGIPFDHLPPLYAMASLSSYTSRFEGFGIPVIESLSAGTPVIACTGSVLEEAGGPGAVYIDPDDVEAYASEAMRILDDTAHRSSLVKLGQEYIRRFTHENMAGQIMEVYTKAING